jgi:hypothetical protein
MEGGWKPGGGKAWRTKKQSKQIYVTSVCLDEDDQKIHQRLDAEAEVVPDNRRV